METLKGFVEGLDLTPEDLLMVLSSVVSLKKQRPTEEGPKENKVYQDKYFLWDNSTDGFIYRDGRTKSKNFYIRIYCKETKRVLSRSLRTSSKEEGMVLGRQIYKEMYGKLIRGEKTKSLTTDELIEKYLKEEEKKISPFPQTGITELTFKRKGYYLNNWSKYVKDELRMVDTSIQNIPSDITRDFGYWMTKQEKGNYSNRKSWSSDYINSVISEVLKMYKDVGVTNKYISEDLVPKIKFLKNIPTNQTKRDILNVDEYERLVTYLRTNKFLKPEGSTLLDQTRRSIFREFIGISYNTGMRPSEILKLKWGDVSINITDTKENQKIYRILKVRTENSKTGRMRSVNGPVGRRLERLKETYEKLGFQCSPDQYIFKNTHPRSTLR